MVLFLLMMIIMKLVAWPAIEWLNVEQIGSSSTP